MNIIEFINNIKKDGILPSFDVKMILSNFYNIEISEIINFYDKEIKDGELAKLNLIIEERQKGKPVSKIFNKKYFWEYCFFVNENVLDPRPDFEIMISEILKTYKNENLKILDLGTGSGCLIITILKLFSNFTGTAVDISDKALEVAKLNSRKLEVFDRINFIKSNWNDNVDGKFDIIISNPPYIETDIIEKLDVDVKEYDPILALDGGNDGLECYKKIAQNIRKNCKDNTKIFLEIGVNQKNSIIKIFSDYGFKFEKSTKDYGGIERILTFSN